MSIIKNLIDSFKNNKDGFSGRKLSAFTAVGVAAYLSNKFCNINTILYVTISWLTFALLCLGVVTAENLLNLYMSQKSNNNEPDNISQP